MLRGHHKVATLSRNPENDENRSRDFINALIISYINKRDHLTRRIHYKLLGCKKNDTQNDLILFHL